ncbi:MAG TPA: alpha amylase C-terminal domain-containing protein [Polyangiaceae bacterium]
MPNRAELVSPRTQMGATLVDDGATFRTWAPNARDVYVAIAQHGEQDLSSWSPSEASRLTPLGDGTWGGFVAGVREGDAYLFFVRGPTGGTEGFKRDPYARELGLTPAFPNCPCLIRAPHGYPWHDSAWRTPSFHELVIYQLHVGVFWAVDADGQDRRRRYGKFLDAVERIPYLRDLGINAVQLLPIQEYDREFGLGYANLDFYSPEMTLQVEDPIELERHCRFVNGLLQERGAATLSLSDLAPGPNQLKCFIDLCHLHGIAVIFDLVYNHAGGGFSDRDLHFYDRQPPGDDNRSLYFTDRGWAGGRVFAYWQDGVRQFLIDNACFFLNEYRIDGIRYDEVTVIHDHGGERFARDLTSTVRFLRRDAIQIAEYWGWDRAAAVTPAPSGLGFDAALADGLRDELRQVLALAAIGNGAPLPLDRLRDALYRPAAFPAAWRAVHCLENHDVVRWDYERRVPRAPRVPQLADPSNARSWYARSRARVATTLLLTAPGIPMLFMGQEIFEDKPWHDDVANWAQFLIWWDGLSSDRVMQDFHRCVRDLLWLRRSQPALHAEGVRVPQVHEQDRIFVVHRWVEGEGDDIVIVASFRDTTLDGYRIEFPHAGSWLEVFNSDVYDHFPNAWAVGNAGRVVAHPGGGTVYPASAALRIPANGALILRHER